MMSHDHSRCITAAIARAEALSKATNKRLTPVRRRVLELIWASHKPRTAYDILTALMAEGYGSSPPVAYRALAFLSELGLIHKLQHRNAYVGCPGGDKDHMAQLFLCKGCGTVTETTHQSVSAGLHKAAHEIGFAIDHPMVEVIGRCRSCQIQAQP